MTVFVCVQACVKVSVFKCEVVCASVYVRVYICV